VCDVRTSSEENDCIVEILLERADRILASDGGRNCKRVLTDVGSTCYSPAMNRRGGMKEADSPTRSASRISASGSRIA